MLLGFMVGTLVVVSLNTSLPSAYNQVPSSLTGQSLPKRKKVIRLEAITVEGRIQKPQAFYILQRSSLNFDELNRTESFLPKLVKSVDKDPF